MSEHTVGYRDLLRGLEDLQIPADSPVISHVSLSAFGQVSGGAETVVGALLENFSRLIMPTFTYKTMITPEVGPPDNGIEYGCSADQNRMAEFFSPEMPVDRLIGAVAETLRGHPDARRTHHPILSFCGVRAEAALREQSIENPLAPIEWLARHQGWVVLMGVDHTSNTSIHYAEQQSGRAGFIRWALFRGKVCQCPGFPGCSDGFQSAEPALQLITRQTQIGKARISALSISQMVEIIQQMLADDPHALLCKRPNCARCRTAEKR